MTDLDREVKDEHDETKHLDRLSDATRKLDGVVFCSQIRSFRQRRWTLEKRQRVDYQDDSIHQPATRRTSVVFVSRMTAFCISVLTPLIWSGVVLPIQFQRICVNSMVNRTILIN